MCVCVCVCERERGTYNSRTLPLYRAPSYILFELSLSSPGLLPQVPDHHTPFCIILCTICAYTHGQNTCILMARSLPCIAYAYLLVSKFLSNNADNLRRHMYMYMHHTKMYIHCTYYIYITLTHTCYMHNWSYTCTCALCRTDPCMSIVHRQSAIRSH